MNRRLKILIYTFGLCTGGTERQIIELCRGLSSNRFDLSIAVARPGGEWESLLAQAGIVIKYFPLNNLHNFNAIRQLQRLRTYLVENSIDLLHTFSLLGNTFGVLAGLWARVPIIITSRRDLYEPHGLPYHEWLQALLSHSVDNIVTNAAAIKQMLVRQEHIRSCKISIIHNGIDLTQFIDRSFGAQVRYELGIEEGTPVIGVVAELKQVKGHIYLLQAARQLINHWPNLRLLLVGSSINEPETKTNLAAVARELGIEKNTIFLGRSQEVPRLFTAMDVSVLPSLSEGLSNTILESMAAGVPVIATNVGGNSELIKENKTGLLVPPKDPMALAYALRQLLKDPLHRALLAENAQRMVRERFTNKQMSYEMEALYLKIVESKATITGLSTRLGLRRRVAT
ncbi:MAG: glycosyltransferase [Acidobacteriota bacterium]